MATTTPFYGWRVPTSTDLVKDGASAIEILGDSIDASMNTALGTKKAGMVLINTTTFSAVASQSFNNVFSSTYENYYAILRVTASADTAGSLRFRVGGADNSTSNYNRQTLTAASTTVSATSTSSQTSYSLGTVVSTEETFELFFFRPQLTSKTVFGFRRWKDTTNEIQIVEGFFNATTVFDGFTLLPTSPQTLSGVVSIYGYNI